MATLASSTTVEFPESFEVSAFGPACGVLPPAGVPDPFEPMLVGSESIYRAVGERLFGSCRRTLGRYELKEHLGHGAMGKVMSAYDPQLVREVAIKLVHPRSADPRQAREALLEDARAAARVRHPAVVQVYDSGIDGEEAFVVMELVRGTTLGRWLRQRPRPWREIVRMFVRAGRGLVAVHAAGLVHRDFKPSNVLVDDKGRPRVADFGLARSISPKPATDPSVGSSAAGADPSASVAGTPRYMAPEQFVGRGVGPHSDQYAFCVCLYEALFGVHPFIAAEGGVSDLGQLARLHRRPRLRGHRRIPRRVTQLVLRGLAPAPNQRHPSLETLVDGLDAVVRRRRRVATVGSLAALILLGATVGRYWTESSMRDCTRGARQLAGLWTEHREKVEVRLGEVAEGAHPLVSSTVGLLDDRVEAWGDTLTATCVETKLSRGGESSGELNRESSMAPCLDARRNELEVLLQSLESWDKDIRLAQEHVLGFDLSSGCTHGELRGANDPERHAVFEALAEASARSLAGEWYSARTTARAAGSLAERAGLGDLRVEALIMEAQGFIEDGRHQEGLEVLRRARGPATRHGDPRLLAKLELTSIQAELHGTGQPNLELRQRLESDLEVARIHVSDAGEPDELLVKLGLTQAELHLVAGRTRDAVDAYRDALRRLAGVHPATSRRSAVLANNLAVALLELDQTDEAESVVRASYEAFVDQGVDHAQPDWAAMLRMLGIIHATQGRQREARGEFEQALRLLEGRDDERSRRQVLELYQHLAVLEYQRGDHERARASFERLLSEQIAYFGHDDVELLWTLDSLAELALEHGQVEQARAHAVRRLRIAEQGYGVGHPEVAMAEMMLGKVLLALGIEAEAGLRLERAHRRLRDSEALPLWRAESAYHYARYLHRTGAVDRARTVLARARAILESASDGFLLLDTLDDWAQEHEVEI